MRNWFVSNLIGTGAEDDDYRSPLADESPWHEAVIPPPTPMQRDRPGLMAAMVYAQADQAPRGAIMLPSLRGDDAVPASQRNALTLDIRAKVPTLPDLSGSRFDEIITQIGRHLLPGFNVKRPGKRLRPGSFLVDSFTDTPAQPLSSHTPETGGSWARMTGTSTFQISSGGRCGRNGSSGTRYYNSATPGSANYDIVGDFYRNSASGGEANPELIGRIASPGTSWDGYVIQYRWDEGDWRLRRFDNGSATTLGTHTGNDITGAGGESVVTLSFTASDIKAYVGATEILSSTDSTYSAAGLVGIGLVGNSSTVRGEIDDLSATDDTEGAILPSQRLLTGAG